MARREEGVKVDEKNRWQKENNRDKEACVRYASQAKGVATHTVCVNPHTTTSDQSISGDQSLNLILAAECGVVFL